MKLYLLVFLFLISCHGQAPAGQINDPGEAGKKTLVGIDKDNDGVRDDLQIWIEKSFAESESIRKAVREMAKVHPASCELPYKTQCLESIVGFDKSLAIELELMERYLNTPERQKDFEERSKECPSLSEMVVVKCPFDVD